MAVLPRPQLQNSRRDAEIRRGVRAGAQAAARRSGHARVACRRVPGAKALDERDWAAAAASFRKGVELAPNEPSLHHKLGTALFMRGDARGAIDQFEEALRLSPGFAKANYSLGVLMGSNGRPDKAIEHLSAAVRDDPAYVEARLRLADVLRATGRLAPAL